MSRERILLGYGAGAVSMTYDTERFDVVLPDEPAGGPLTADALRSRLGSPIGSAPLEEIALPGRKVVIVVPDATRASGSAVVAPLLLERLEASGVPDADVAFLVGAGTHRPPTAEEILRILGPEASRRARVVHHDAFDPSRHAHFGTTSRGTPVELNRLLGEADAVVLVGAIGFHYFAGFSAGRKGLLPACASERAIQANHLLAFDTVRLTRAEGVASGRLDGNPVSEDMEEACALFGPHFAVGTVLDAHGRIAGLYAGHWRASHRQGCADYLAAHAAPVEAKRPLVVASCGGAPRDINMIQSHKALEHARFLLDDEGDLILLAECPEGLGRPDFLDWFVPGGAAATARKLVTDYKLNGQTAWGIRWKAERYRVRLVSSLPPDAVRRMGMIPHRSLDEALREAGEGTGWILPQGLATLPVVAGPAKAASAVKGG
ncbi:MAG TPA: nickel-dependent lactate racemase [Candidatus Polarisedimenticolia bacterium]|nr:nickel-dependent lactate racemase [Candidatus Polarisedimenticolia bacterium]